MRVFAYFVFSQIADVCLLCITVSTKARTADMILAKTVLHQIIICPPNNGGSISISISIRSGSVKVKKYDNKLCSVE